MQIRLRNILTERGIKVKTIADALGVDMTSIPVYDRFAPSMESMKRIADYLQIPTWELFCDCGRSSWVVFQQTVTEPLMDRFARRLKELARERHIQLNVVAERAGMSKANLSLSMKRNITTSTIEKIACALDVEDKAYLLFITPNEYDAIYHAPASSFDILQPVRAVVGVETNDPLLSQEEKDLFARLPEKKSVLADGIYYYGAMRIKLKDGKVTVEGSNPNRTR